MRIAVDGRELAPHPTGVGRYLLEILQAWAQDPDAGDCDVTVWAPTDLDLSSPRLVGPGARIQARVLPGARGTVWEQLRLPLALLRETDVLYAPAYSAPVFAPAPTVVTVHDVSFCAHPEWFGPREGARRRWTCRLSAANAATVLTVSAFSKTEIVRWLGVPPNRVVVTPLGVSTRVRPPAAVDREHAAPLVLFVGSQLNRRHVPDLVRAFAPLVAREARARLVLVGDNRSHPPEDARAVARDLGIAAAVDTRPWIADAELAALYGAATAFAWLSTYEGFGLPPLEAMAAGVPVVAYDTAVAREVYGTAATLVPVGHVEAVTAALVDLGTDPVRRAAARQAGLEHVTRFDWARTGRATLAALRGAAR
ncbi:MAG: glycosyltransferase family 1 protein [Vicinamibacteraceae bacterium]